MKPYIIRDITENDMDALMPLIVVHAAYEKLDYVQADKKERLRRAIFAEPANLRCWVVEHNGEIAGYCAFTKDYSTCDAGYYLHMDCLYLIEDIRGLGIGTEIINRLKQVAVENNCYCIQWQTPSFNLPAINFYHKNGASSLEKMRFTLNV